VRRRRRARDEAAGATRSRNEGAKMQKEERSGKKKEGEKRGSGKSDNITEKKVEGKRTRNNGGRGRRKNEEDKMEGCRHGIQGRRKEASARMTR
jgi:hypothetical protein